MMEECVNFLSDEFKLEGILSYNEDDGSDKDDYGLVLLCPPHPGLGGDIDNNVVLALAEALTLDGYVTLRFNYRGVGESGSRFSNIAQKFEYWESTMGSEDYGDFITDVESAMECLKKETGFTDGRFCALIGYSFGAVQALRVGVMDKDVDGVVCISTPFAKYDLSFAEGAGKPTFFINSDNDFAASIEEITNGVERFSEPKCLEMIIDCDHFYRDKEGTVVEKVIKFLKVTKGHNKWDGCKVR